MKEQGIIFTGDSVLLIADGLKWQTRRVIKPQSLLDNKTKVTACYECPYGQPGDMLWVRESWQAWKEFDKVRANALPDAMKVRINYPANGNTWNARIRPSIHMPRWACRILLEVTDVRVERIQEISEEDAKAEGCHPSIVGDCLDHLRYRAGFSTLWNRINAHRGYSWDVNPWVWAISFKVMKP